MKPRTALGGGHQAAVGASHYPVAHKSHIVHNAVVAVLTDIPSLLNLMFVHIHHHDAEPCGEKRPASVEADAVYFLVAADRAVPDIGDMIHFVFNLQVEARIIVGHRQAFCPLVVGEGAHPHIRQPAGFGHRLHSPFCFVVIEHGKACGGIHPLGRDTHLACRHKRVVVPPFTHTYLGTCRTPQQTQHRYCP